MSPTAVTETTSARNIGSRPRGGAWSLPEVRCAAVATALFLIGLSAQAAGGPPALVWAVYPGCYAAGGWEPGRAGLRALRSGTLDVDLLMVAAALGAAAIGQVFDGALLIVIFATSGALEAVATKRTEDSVRALLDLTPETARRLDTAGVEETVNAADLDIGDVLVIRPGERIGGDGLVIDGAGEVDEAGITGEPLPADKSPGDDVYAGTVNGTGSLRVRVTKPAAETVVARIAALVVEAGASKARLQLFIEKVEQRYSVGMVAATIAVFAIPLIFGSPVQVALLRAMTFMIVASPCALVLSTMPPLLAAIANAGRHGVLVKSAVALEKLASAERVAFDKTGTLTDGAPRLAAVRPLPGVDRGELLVAAAAAELPSEHPLGAAIVAVARRERLDLPGATEFGSLPGRGVRARLGANLVEVGRPSAIDRADGRVGSVVDELENSGHTAVVVRVDGSPTGVLGILDRPRPEAAAAVDRLGELTGARPALLTGDNARAAARLAAELGIDDVHAGLLPEDKVAVVRQLESAGNAVMFVGDGVNDAPAMATAHVAVAMGRTGSDLALDTADIVMARDDLAALPGILALSRRARRVVTANLVIAAVFLVVLVTWDLAGHLPLPLGVAGHEGSTVLVGLNGLRLLRNRAWPG